MSREKRRTFRFHGGTSTTLRVIDQRHGWIDIVQGPGDPYCLDPEHPDYSSTHVIATARRFYRSEGCNFTGWLIEAGRNHSDPIRGKENALAELLREVEDILGGEFA